MKLKMGHAAAAVSLLAGLLSSSVQADVLYFDFNDNSLATPTASVFLFGDAGQSATVSNLAGFSQTVTLGANGFFNLPIANIYQQSGTGIKETGFSVVSPNPIGGYFVNRAPFTTDMTYLLNQAALGKEYVVASFGISIGEGSQVAIHATQNNTAVSFKPTVGPTVNVVLNAGQTYKYAGGGADLTGSQVSSDKPVAVFSGHNCANTGAGACDTLLEQMIPTNLLSKQYALVASKSSATSGNGGDLVRVIATADNTQVTVGGAVVALLNAGQYYQFLLNSATGQTVNASNPVAVAQYLRGGGNNQTDPALSVVPGSDTWLNKYRLATPSGAQAFNTNFASLVIETDDLGSLKLDGVAVNTSGCTGIAGTLFSRCDVDLPLGLFDLTSTDPFLVMLGGSSNFDSYFTYGGATFAPGISPPPPPPNGVPEPGSFALLSLGLAGLLALRRPRQHA